MQIHRISFFLGLARARLANIYRSPGRVRAEIEYRSSGDYFRGQRTEWGGYSPLPPPSLSYICISGRLNAKTRALLPPTVRQAVLRIGRVHIGRLKIDITRACHYLPAVPLSLTVASAPRGISRRNKRYIGRTVRLNLPPSRAAALPPASSLLQVSM